MCQTEREDTGEERPSPQCPPPSISVGCFDGLTLKSRDGLYLTSEECERLVLMEEADIDFKIVPPNLQAQPSSMGIKEYCKKFLLPWRFAFEATIRIIESMAKGPRRMEALKGYLARAANFLTFHQALASLSQDLPNLKAVVDFVLTELGLTMELEQTIAVEALRSLRGVAIGEDMSAGVTRLRTAYTAVLSSGYSEISSSWLINYMRQLMYQNYTLPAVVVSMRKAGEERWSAVDFMEALTRGIRDIVMVAGFCKGEEPFDVEDEPPTKKSNNYHQNQRNKFGQKTLSITTDKHTTTNNNNKPFSKYVQVSFDTQNRSQTLVPRRLRDLAVRCFKLKDPVYFVGVLGSEVAECDEGVVIGLMVDIEENSERRKELLYITGVLSDHVDEIIVARSDLPDGIDLTKGKTSPITGSLRYYPGVKICLGSDACSVFEIVKPTSSDICVSTAIEKYFESTNCNKETKLLMESVNLIDKDNTFDSKALINKLHWMLGHPSAETLRKTMKVWGVTISRDLIEELTKGCSCLNQHRARKPYKTTVETKKESKKDITMQRGKIAQQDITYLPRGCIGGYKYISTIVDTSTKLVSLEILKQKWECVLHTAEFLEQAQHISIIRFDNAAEFVGKDMSTVLARHGVARQTIAPGSSQSLGAAERANGVVKATMEKLLESIGLGDRHDLSPWVVKAAQTSLNNRHLDSLTALNFGDPIRFQAYTDPRKGLSPYRKGIYLARLHSGACEVLTGEDKKLVRYIVHPHTVTALPDSEKDILQFNIRYAAGVEECSYWETTAHVEQEKQRRVRIYHDTEHNIPWERTQHAPTAARDDGETHHLIVAPKRMNSAKSPETLNSSPNDERQEPDNKPLQRNTAAKSKPKKVHCITPSAPMGSKFKESEVQVNKVFRIAKLNITTLPKRLKRVLGNDQALHAREVVQHITQHNPALRKGASSLTRSFEDDSGQLWYFTQKPFKGRVYVRCNETSDEKLIDLKSSMYKTFPVLVTPRQNGCQQVLRLTDVKAKRKQTKTSRPKGHFAPGFGWVADDEVDPRSIENGEFDIAYDKEWTAIITQNVLEEVDSNTSYDCPIKSRFRLTRKLMADGSEKPKARFIVCATDDKRDVQTFTTPPSATLRRILSVIALSHGFQAATIDVQTAFLLVPLNYPVYIRLPEKLPSVVTDKGYLGGTVYRLRKALYGLKEAPRLFSLFLKNVMERLGWEAISLLEGIYRRTTDGVITGLAVCYVDDIMMWSHDPQSDLDKIAQTIPCSDLLPVCEKGQRHVGLTITGVPGRLYMDITDYISRIYLYESEVEALPEPYRRRVLKPSNLPFNVLTDPDWKPQEDHSELTHMMQEIAGVLGWIGTCHPAVASRHGGIACLTTTPSPMALRIGLGTLRELVSEGVHPLEFQLVESPEIRLWVDSAVRVHRGRRAWVLQIADKAWPLTNRTNLVGWRSATDDIMHTSSTEGEVYAITKALEDVRDIKRILEVMNFNAPWRVFSDSMSGIQQINNGGHTIVNQEKTEYTRFLLDGRSIEHVSTLIQIADPLTKVMPLNWFAKVDKL